MRRKLPLWRCVFWRLFWLSESNLSKGCWFDYGDTWVHKRSVHHVSRWILQRGNLERSIWRLCKMVGFCSFVGSAVHFWWRLWPKKGEIFSIKILYFFQDCKAGRMLIRWTPSKTKFRRICWNSSSDTCRQYGQVHRDLFLLKLI